MKIRDIMTPDPKGIAADATLEDAAKLMKKEDVGWLPVVSEGKVLGALTDRDIVIRGVAEGKNPRAEAVRAIAVTPPICCKSDATPEDAARLMMSKKIRRLLVVNDQELPLGVVTIGDLATQIEDDALAGEVLDYICRAS